jgi:hypothetical protein
VLLTTDKNMPYQQNLAGRKIAVVVLGLQQWPKPSATCPARCRSHQSSDTRQLYGGRVSVGAEGFPSRRWKLSPAGPIVLHAKVRGRVGRCRH